MSDLTAQQQTLLAEIEASDGGVFVTIGSMTARTADALFRKGLVSKGAMNADTSFYGPLAHPEDPVPDPPAWLEPTE